ncbi:MAG TPA: hypothetical protein VIT00_08985 [Terrimicrobiaceae bacterium]
MLTEDSFLSVSAIQTVIKALWTGYADDVLGETIDADTLGSSMEKVADYKLAAVKKPEMLEALVNEFLKDGYKLYGSPFCSADRYCQAIVKYGESGK